jgi:glycosyltransferase involved in cell wall biosynthesis
MITFLNRIDTIHYLTEYQRGIYLRFGLNPLRYKVIPNLTSCHTYTDYEVNTLRTKLLEDTSSESIIVYVGRLVESKQLHVFIDVIKKINQLKINVGGIIVGKGDQSYTNKLHRISSELDIASKIVFAGFSTQPELYIKTSDFCLFPTLHEALPLFILETFSQQKTIVVSNHQSINNIVENYVDSLVSEKHTSDAYAVKCIELIENPQLLKKLERGARDKYDTFYKPEKVIDEFKKMYLEILEK